MTRFRCRMMLSLAPCLGLFLLAACVMAGFNDVVGEWDWVDGQRLVLRPDQSLEVYKGNERINEGSWECIDQANQRYVFRHRNGGWVDSVTLSPDGRSLYGKNQRGYSLQGNRVSSGYSSDPGYSGGSGFLGGSNSGRGRGNRGGVVGQWDWVDGQTLILRSNQTLEVYKDGERINTGTWECVDERAQRYVFRHRNGGWVDSVTLSADGQYLDGRNQQGYTLRGTRSSGGSGFSGDEDRNRDRGKHRHPDRFPGRGAMDGNSGFPAGGSMSVVGQWNWVDGQTLILRPNQTLEVYKDGERINEGTWRCVDEANRRYVFRHRNGGWVDSVVLSTDGAYLDGQNQEGNALHGSRSQQENDSQGQRRRPRSQRSTQ